MATRRIDSEEMLVMWKRVLKLLAASAVWLPLVGWLLGMSEAVAEGQQTDRSRSQRLYPALQRELGDPELVARGQVLYGINCRACHGIDLRGGDLGGPNLLRSQLVLRDQAGELLGPVIRDGQVGAGGSVMPAQSLADDEIQAVTAYVHDVLGTASRQGGPPLGEEVELDILVGDAGAGRTYFIDKCESCHSPTGDLEGFATRVSEPQELQNRWVRGGARAADAPAVTVTVTMRSGEQVQGFLERINDFLVVLTDADGRHRSFSRRGVTPGVELDDPMAVHRAMLPLYSDTDIHNVTAYLATLK